MENDEIVKLLREIRDIQSERLALQKQSLHDQAKAQSMVGKSLNMQKTGLKVQAISVFIAFFLIIFAALLLKNLF